MDSNLVVSPGIAERKESEQRLTEAAEKFERQTRLFNTLLSSIIDFAYIFDSQARFIYASQPLIELLEIGAEEIIGKTFFDLNYPPDLAARLEKQIHRVFDAGEIVRDDTQFTNPSGETGFYEYIFTPVFADDGTVEYVAGSTRDITERVRAETALRVSEEKYRAIFEQANIGIVQLSFDGRFLAANPGYCKIIGYDEDELKRMRVRDVAHPDDYPLEEAENRRLLNGKISGYALEKRCFHRDGSILWKLMTATLIRSETGEPLYVLSIDEDITPRKQTEAALRESEEERRLAHQNLEIKVAERTGELAKTNKSLEAEIAERRQLEDERARLVKKIVGAQEQERHRIALDLHDHLGQQLTALRLNLELLRGLCDRADLGRQVEETQAIARKIDSDVDFLAWELRPSALGDLGAAAAIANYAREWSKQFNIPVEFNADRFGRERLARETESNLYRIAQESLNNISKHAKASRVEVLLERRRDFAVLIIEDDGRGFEPEKAIVTASSPRGLGLVGMRERAALVGGSLEIESAPGAGATVYARVPIRGAAAEKTDD